VAQAFARAPLRDREHEAAHGTSANFNPRQHGESSRVSADVPPIPPSYARQVVPRPVNGLSPNQVTKESSMDVRRFLRLCGVAAVLLVVVTVAAFGTGAAATALAPVSVRPSFTVRVDDRRISAPARMPAGYVDIHIVTSGKVHHHLAFWHLNRGVTAKRFIRVLKAPNGDPFKLSTAIGGNGPTLAGRLDTTMRLVPGTVVVADIVEGPTTRFARFRVSGPAASTRPPTALGTIVNRSYRFFVPPRFGRPGLYRFTNPDSAAHDGAIFRLIKGKTATDLVRWMRRGGKGQPPVDFDRPLGGPGVIGAHWTSWFRVQKLSPGRCVIGCFLPDPGGALHAADGMVAGFAVH
jgi:hypothetical protein